MIELAFGYPERSVSDGDLFRVLGTVAAEIERPDLRVVLGPPNLGIRWVAFAHPFGRHPVAVDEEEVVPLLTNVAESVLVARRPNAKTPFRFVAGKLRLELVDGAIAVHGGLPADARCDGDVDQIGLGVLGLPVVRPFDALAAPTHHVRLRADGKPRPAKIEKIRTGLALSFLHASALDATPPHRVLVHRPRVPGPGDVSEAAGQLAQRLREIRLHHGQVYEDSELVFASGIARCGPAMGAPLVEQLQRGSRDPRVTRQCLLALGMLGQHADAVVPFIHRGSSLASAAWVSLLCMGEAARPALIAAQQARKAAERALADVLLRVLDDRRFAMLRAAREARDALPSKLAAEIKAIADSFVDDRLAVTLAQCSPTDRLGAVALFCRRRSEFHTAPFMASATLMTRKWPEVVWAYALYLVETPLAEHARRTALEALAADFRSELVPVADVLLELPPFADDPELEACATGRRPPTRSKPRKRRKR